MIGSYSPFAVPFHRLFVFLIMLDQPQPTPPSSKPEFEIESSTEDDEGYTIVTKRSVGSKNDGTPLSDSSITAPSQQSPSSSSSLSIFRLGLCLAIFVVFASFVALCWSYLPPPSATDPSASFAFPPRSLDDAKTLGQQLGQYTDSNFGLIVTVYLATYIFLQTFAIPGSIFLSILSGALFPFSLALFLVCTSAAFGASFANLISSFIARDLVEKYLAQRLAQWRESVSRHRDNMLNYIIFLRITPLVPNFFINIASPLVDVPLGTFFLGTFIGVAPPSILFVKMGQTLQQLTTTSVPVSTMVGLVAIGFVSLLPVLYKDRLKKKLE